MADSKITDLSELTTPATDDVLAVVDISEAAAADKNKKIQVSNVLKGAADGTAALPSIAFGADTDTGMYRKTADTIGFSTGGTNRAYINNIGQVLIGYSSSTSGFTDQLLVLGTGRINNIKIHAPYSLNMGFGDDTFDNITSGATRNTAIGENALQNLTSGDDNTALGYDALNFVQGGTDNTAVGKAAARNSTGYYNTAIGSESLYSGGSYNTAVGTAAGDDAGNYNTYAGYRAGKSQEGDSNVAIGINAFNKLVGTNGNSDYNVAIGSSAMTSNASGDGNTCVGANSGNLIASGNDNTCLGREAGSDITTGSGNIVIGDRNAAGTSAPVHTITTADNRVVMGSTAVTNAYIQVGWTTVSDERDKTNFAEVPHGLDFVTQLNPVAFQFRESRESDVAVGPVRYGFKAQEVMALEGTNPVIIDNEDQNRLKYTAEGLVPVLVNAIKEQQQQIAALQARIDALEAG